MEIFVKNIKLFNNSKAIVKSKWCDDTIKLDILVGNQRTENWKIYKGECTTKDIQEQCDPLNIEYELMKNYLTCETNTDGIMYDITGNKLLVFKKEYLGSDSEGYADIILFNLSLDCEEISSNILLEQFNDIMYLTSVIRRNNESAKKDVENRKIITDEYEKLLIEKQEFEKEFYKKAVALFNAKKKCIQDNLAKHVTNLNISHISGTSEDPLMTKEKEQKIYSSPSRTPKRHSSKKVITTPKRTPNKGLFQRTPSKRLREIQDMSDSDDSFTILSCGDTNNKFTSKSVTNSLDTSRVFKDFKVKTPIKQQKEQKRESSVELKIDRNTNEIVDSESEHKSLESKTSKGSNPQNAQQMDIDEYNHESQPLLDDTIVNKDDEEIPCSQEMPEMQESLTSFSERLKVKAQKKSKKLKAGSSINPYSVDTVNV